MPAGPAHPPFVLVERMPWEAIDEAVAIQKVVMDDVEGKLFREALCGVSEQDKRRMERSH